MNAVKYRIVEHDGGWAYRVDETYSETFPSHDAAFGAARRAACRQLRPGETTDIVWEDATGHWHAELSRAGDRPQPQVIGLSALRSDRYRQNRQAQRAGPRPLPWVSD